MPNSFEQAPEQIPTKEEIIKEIARHAENAVITGELSDENGLYFLEMRAEGEKPDESTEYVYQRKGAFPGRNPNNTIASANTSVSAIFYEGEMPVGGKEVSVFNPDTGEWSDA